VDLLTLTILAQQHPERMVAYGRSLFGMESRWPLHAACALQMVDAASATIRDNMLCDLSEGPAVHGQMCVRCQVPEAGLQPGGRA
jgi:hypothetical protein